MIELPNRNHEICFSFTLGTYIQYLEGRNSTFGTSDQWAVVGRRRRNFNELEIVGISPALANFSFPLFLPPLHPPAIIVTV